MKVYEHKGFPNPMRVRVALAEKGLTDGVEFVQVDVTKGEHKTPAFLAAIRPAPCQCWSLTTARTSPSAPRSPNISTISTAIRC